MQMFELEGRAMLRSASGEPLGEIESYVVDPAAKEVTHIVVEAGVVFPERRLVPTDLIDHIGEDGPVLAEAVDVESLPPYETEHFVPIDQVTRNRIDPRLGEASIWRYPTLATGWYPDYPGEPIPYRIEEEWTTVQEVNVPAERAFIDEHTPVVSAEGDLVGSVRELTIDGAGNLSHLTVRVEGLDGDRVVPGHWIESVDEDQITLAVGRLALEGLEPARR